ncbi:MAG TPA: L,D-transpeptidase, partial [Anaerolineales bacterium]|nr:L,D-transpeptidase [Anaerolineales bacterium]
YLFLLLGIEWLLLAIFGLFIFARPALASMMNTPVPAQEILWAPVYVPKPTITPQAIQVAAPSETPVDASSLTDTPVTVMDVVDGTYPDSNDQSLEDQRSDDGRWIDVNLSEQRIYAYEGDVMVNSFIVSTGLPDTPTVTGEFRIYVKVPVQDMSGPGYYLSDVPWVMFFYDEYGFHGTYWHSNFGTPMSRGCVNLRTEEAEWLYHWASVGMPVSVHY